MLSIRVHLLLLLVGTATADDGLQKLIYLKGKMKDGTIQLGNKSFQKYAVESPRPYHMVLFFTAQNAKYKCDVCQRTYPEFVSLAQSYQNTRKNMNEEIIFGIVDYEKNKDAFSIFQFTSAPQLVYLPMSDGDDKTISVDSNNIFNFYSQGSKAENMLSFVKQRSRLEFTIETSIVPLLMSLGVSLLFVCSFVYLVFRHTEYILRKLRSKRLWMSISWLLYGLSVSGMVYCVIRDPPPFQAQRSGQIQLFHPAGRQQYVIEGLIIGGCNVVAAFSVIVLTQRAPKIVDPNQRMTLMIFAITCFFFTYRFIVRSYMMKNQWYSHHSWL